MDAGKLQMNAGKRLAQSARAHLRLAASAKDPSASKSVGTAAAAAGLAAAAAVVAADCRRSAMFG